MDVSKLKEIILQQNSIKPITELIIRSKFKTLKTTTNVTIISGIRRCGKSTLLQQIRLNNKEQDYYINFDDERLLHFNVTDFQLLHETFIELFGIQKTFYFDEIQNINYWEKFVRRLHNEGFKVYITGSNANLLSKELGTHLTGRHIQIELFPFSFKEFLDLKKIKLSSKTLFTTNGKASIKKQYQNYIHIGGFPEYIKDKNNEYLKSLYNSILYKDILVRNNIINELEVRELGHFIASNISKLITLNSLKKIINVKHTNTTKNYLQYFQDTYLIFLVNKFDYSVRKQIHNPKKLYFIDNALASTISFRFSEDRGRFLENVVFLELKRSNFEIYYHKIKSECDFLIREKSVITMAIQVSISLYDQKTKEREIKGLLEAMETHHLKEGTIITENEEEEIIIKNKKISIIPIFKWLLNTQI